MTIKFLLDADLPHALIRGLKRRSNQLDVLRVNDIGLSTAKDPEILTFAANEGRIVVSRDKATMKDFAAQRIRDGKTMPGLLLVRPTFARRHGRGLMAVIEDLLLIAECSEADEWNGLIQYVPL